MNYCRTTGRPLTRCDRRTVTVNIRTRPCIHSNNGDTCRALALADQGIILQPDFVVGDDIRAGRLVELMPEYRAGELGAHAVYPSRRHVAPKVRAAIDFLAEHFAARPLG